MVKAEAEVKKKLRSFGRRKQTLLFEVGRVCVINYGADVGKLCIILDFVDSTRALIDGPESITGVARGTIPFKRLSVTPLRVKVVRSARSVKVAEAFKKADIAAQFAKLPWGKKLARNEIRRNLTDYDRFRVMILKKKRSFLLRRQIKRQKGIMMRTEGKRFSGKKGRKNMKEIWAAAVAKGEENPPSRVSKKYLRYALKVKEIWAKKLADPNYKGKRTKDRLARSNKRSKKKSAARLLRSKTYKIHMRFKRKQASKKVKKDDKKMRRVRLKKTFAMRVNPRNATSLPKNATAKDVQIHKMRYKARRSKFKRSVKKARLAKAREAKKNLKEYKEQQKANRGKGDKVSKRKPKKAKK